MTESTDAAPAGIRCPSCACAHHQVIWVRKRELTVDGQQVGGTIRRRRCRHCGREFTTTERLADP